MAGNLLRADELRRQTTPVMAGNLLRADELRRQTTPVMLREQFVSADDRAIEAEE